MQPPTPQSRLYANAVRTHPPDAGADSPRTCNDKAGGLPPPACFFLVAPTGFARVKRGGYVGPSYKSLCSFGATYLIGENVDVKTAQAHFGHKRSSTTLELYAEQVPAHEREVAKTMDAFVKAALGDEAPEEQSLEAFREAIATLPPSEWPDWVRELADLVGGKLPSSTEKHDSNVDDSATTQAAEMLAS